MADELQHVRTTRTVDRAMSLINQAAARAGVSQVLHRAMVGVVRPVYSRSLLFVPTREELPWLLNARGLRGTAVEIGVDEGAFSEHILEHWSGAKLISVDPWLEVPAEAYVDTCNVAQASLEGKYETTARRLARFGERSEIWRETSLEAAARVAPASVDFVYLDARHSYEGVMEDLEAWFALVRPGGLMAGHDYNDGVFVEGVHGVRSAVDEFFGDRSIRVHHTHTDVPSMSWIVQIPRQLPQ